MSKKPGFLRTKILLEEGYENLKIWTKRSFKGILYKKFDIVLFSDKNQSQSVGIILNDNLEWNEKEEPRYEIVYLENFQYIKYVPISKILKKIEHNENFKFINDESNHIFQNGKIINIKYNENFLNEYWEYSNHNFNTTINELKLEFKKFNDFDLNEVLSFQIMDYVGPYLDRVKILKNENKNFELYEIFPEKLLLRYQV